jgi:PIN domain-containing protein
MLVTPYPGANRDDVLSTLRDLKSAAQNAGNVHGPAQDHLTSYLEWATNSVQMLEHRISAADIDRLVLTRGYDRLLAAAGTLTGADMSTQRVLNGLVSHELQQRAQALDAAIQDLDAQIRRWPQDAAFAVADTSVYIEHDDKLRDLDFAALLPEAWPPKLVMVIVPVIVLDELDGLKLRGGDALRRWRASYTLAVIEDLFSGPGPRGILRQPAADGTRRAVFMDILFDPPRHERLPINDDEIIDRALAAQGLAGAPVTLLTFDTSQAARARNAGLAVNKLAKPLGDEPEDTRSKKKARQRDAGEQRSARPADPVT